MTNTPALASLSQLSFIKGSVTEPLSQLLQLFQAPFRLIQKRNDKCLDYDRAKNKWERAKDSKERDKIYQVCYMFAYSIYLHRYFFVFL